ncbi:MAG: hypothetical protein SCALA701_22390 [Candidatus Scalindua sp.]|nr:DUF3365 domain-containing protein [Planctomycetota bacterium]GJQ59438.1 MAG: hypothetical protein SCALA701_22390 [Candidatus Scalindua sp.]
MHIINSLLKKRVIARAKSFHLVLIALFFVCTITAAEGEKEPTADKGISIYKALDALYKAILDEKLDRARDTVHMLDDLYKTFIVLITKEYADDPSVLAAATLSKKVFNVMSKKGWHKARLLDATGSPYNPDNNPRDEFERDAIEAMISGKRYFERIEKTGGINHFRAATVLSADMEGCTYCHPDKKLGDILGAISYEIPLDDRIHFLE